MLCCSVSVVVSIDKGIKYIRMVLVYKSKWVLWCFTVYYFIMDKQEDN